MLNNLFNELSRQYGVDISVVDKLEAYTFKFENNIELYVYLSKDKYTLHIYSIVQSISASDDKLTLFEYLLKFQLMGVKSHHNSFGLSNDGHTIYIYRNFDIHTVIPEQFVRGIKSLATTCEYTREQLQQLHIEPSSQNRPMRYHRIQA
ncbi:CesT family type III secretion system chaperone [Shewanella surugensis]|uniref:Type III secretion system chaperone n=1 Tax=Shewanella surugensis TaxID=212020 RepID=A0ABT0LK04_9GAMM|nr:CesT family type III secretion system chaperone [Shewanella surugensis]MCL1127705.1 type III secretion system chaperone [Shewanella surugensis]